MIKIGSARIDERGKAVGGLPGDQTGREVATEPCYRHKKGWILLRPKAPKKAKAIAEAMLQACANDNIGYDQAGRYGIIQELKKAGSIKNIKTKTEADCSSLVRACCIQAGIDVGDFNTSTEARVLYATGEFQKPEIVQSNTALFDGDILVTKTKGHTVVVVSGSPRSATNADIKQPKDKGTDNKLIEDIAKEVIAGKWGIGTARKKRLEKAGYNYDKVQAEVNKLYKKK